MSGEIQCCITCGRPIPNRKLTEQNKRVLSLIMSGMTNPQIAKEMNLATRTVKAHVGRVMRYLGVTNRVAMAVKCTQPMIRIALGFDEKW